MRTNLLYAYSLLEAFFLRAGPSSIELKSSFPPARYAAVDDV